MAPQKVNHILLNECPNFFIINDIVGKNNPAAPEHEGQQYETCQNG